MSMSFELPKDFLLGSATAATQIEGGDIHNNWYHWSLAGKVGNGESSFTGADHYARYAEDVKLLSKLNQECYRMSIEWSRIEPSEGEWSMEAVAHYRDEFRLLLDAGIKPLVTLHHFSCPEWFQKKGGWLGKDAVQEFLNFVEFSVKQFGDLVSEWCTINEPNVFANDSYVDGKYPPGSHGDIPAYLKVTLNRQKINETNLLYKEIIGEVKEIFEKIDFISESATNQIQIKEKLLFESEQLSQMLAEIKENIADQNNSQKLISDVAQAMDSSVKATFSEGENLSKLLEKIKSTSDDIGGVILLFK